MLLILTFLGLNSLAIGGFAYESKRREAAEARASVAVAERDAYQKSEKELRLRNMILAIERTRMAERRSGWRDALLTRVKQAADIRSDQEVRDQWIASMQGFDARHVLEREGFGGSALVEFPPGDRFLIGGLNQGQGKELRSRISDLATGEVTYSEHTGFWPVAVRNDQTPVQLVYKSPDSFLLWDIARNRRVGRLALPFPERPTRSALASDGSLAAAVVGDRTLIWDVSKAAPIADYPGRATSLEFSPDNQLLAEGDDSGWVKLTAVATGKTIARLRDRPCRIMNMKFARDYRHNSAGESGWLLAVAGTSGSLVIWDLEQRRQRAIFSGIQFDTNALAFNADDTILASGGRQHLAIWDVAQQECLLKLAGKGFHSSVNLSPDASRLVACRVSMFAPDNLTVDKIERGRGFRSLLGLNQPLMSVEISPSGQFILGNTHDHQVGVWEMSTGRLRFVRDAPEAPPTMSFATAMSSDNQQYGLVGGRLAQLMSLDTGRTLRTWRLPPGAFELCSFDDSGSALLVARVERRSGEGEPYNNEDPNDPNVIQLRALSHGASEQPVRELTVFTKGHGAVLGRGLFVFHGVTRQSDGEEHFIRAYDAHTGEMLWSIALPRSMSILAEPRLVRDPTSTILGLVGGEENPKTVLLSMSTGKQVGTLDDRANALGVNPHLPGGFYVTMRKDGERGLALHRNGNGLLVNLGIDEAGVGNERFHPDGRHLLWSNSKGTINVVDLEELQSNLKALEKHP